ncbi:MAG: hypothetical protein QM742_10010 [Aquabacterium sp.]
MNDGTLKQTTTVTEGWDPYLKKLKTSQLDYSYEWWDAAQQSSILNKVNEGAANWAPGISSLTYNVNGHVLQAIDKNINRILTYSSNGQGLILNRSEKVGTALPKIQSYFYFNGHRVGQLGDGVSNTYAIDYTEAITVAAPPQPRLSKRWPMSSLGVGSIVFPFFFEPKWQPTRRSL